MSRLIKHNNRNAKTKGKSNYDNKNKMTATPKPMPKMKDLRRMFNNTNILSYNPDKAVRETGLRSINPSIWVDKYRPRTIDDVIGHDHIKNVIKGSIRTGDMQHLLFYGPPGTGKTSLTHATVRALYGDNVKLNVLELNASDENGINVVRDKIIRFANLEASQRGVNTDNPGPCYKVIILDEADSMTNEAQTALKKVMEKTCKITRFIIICNYENKIIDAIKSRCADFRFDPIPNDMMIDKLKIIAKKENMVMEDDSVYKLITDICEGDARRSINTLQNLKYIPRKNASQLATIATYTKGMPDDIRNDIIGDYEKNMDIDDSKPIITKDDVNLITSSIDYDYFDMYWKQISACPSIEKLGAIGHNIVIEGYPMDYVIKFFKTKVLECELNDIAKSEILLFIGSVERMLANGSGNYIQIVALLTIIVSKYKGIEIRMPKIF